MRLTPATWSRILIFLRLSGIAGGLGFAWLLLGGASADASSLEPGTPPSPAISLQTLTAPALNPAIPVVPEIQKAAASALRTTTTSLASGVEGVPPAVDPLLTGPLAPVAPVVQHAASGVSGTVAAVGATLSQTVATPVPLPSLPNAPTTPAPPTAPAPDSAAPAVNVPPMAPDAEANDSVLAADPQWFAMAAITVAAGAQLAADAGAPVRAPDEPFVLPQAPPSGSGSIGTGSDGPGVATLAAGYLVAPPLLLSGRTRRLRGLVPPSPAFDPGSTPD